MNSNDTVTTCQCSRGEHACRRTITQEDLRCDACRDGCWTLVLPQRNGVERADHVAFIP